MMTKLRVWHNMNGKNFEQEVANIEEAKRVLKLLVKYDLFLDENGFAEIDFNAHGLEEYDEGRQEWFEWYNNDGQDISGILEVEGYDEESEV